MKRAVLVLLFAAGLWAQSPFRTEPYLQLGTTPGQLALLWHSDSAAPVWSVELHTAATWTKLAAPQSRTIAAGGIPTHYVWQAALSGLPVKGGEFEYRVLRSGQPVFTAKARAPKPAGIATRFVVFGDAGTGSREQSAIAVQTLRANPDFVFLPGDIVYTLGRISEYRLKFFPIYNGSAAPLLRSIPFIAAVGNHDSGVRDLASVPDMLAYFLYWSQPLNGPLHGSLGLLRGPGEDTNAFRSGANGAFPKMANFSFNYGDAHWLILDSNPYVDWSAPELRQWIERDLASAQTAWKFVGFHHPAFSSSKEHFEDQWMRRLSPLFEAGGVDVVFAGHVHNYQRSMPLKFQPAGGRPQESLVPGTWTLDTAFDGVRNTTPKGIIHLVSGAGGAALYDPRQNDDRSSWQQFTVKFKSAVHSLTVVDLDAGTAKFRQVSAAGATLDEFTVTKPIATTPIAAKPVAPAGAAARGGRSAKK